jgi:alpha,alpha-trehalase
MKQIHELGLLFEEVQMKNILGDGKTFADCLPRRSLEEINGQFLRDKSAAGFDLKKFIEANFTLPKAYSAGYKSDLTQSPQQHIEKLWDVLKRNPDEAGGSLIPLPHPYIVPGGRFREIYYWDSYFTMLGLRVSKRLDVIENMVSNFEYLIDKVGYIPNGNRTYFLGRSQPPFFSLMVKLLSDEKRTTTRSDEPDPLVKYLPSLEKEYQFWMHGSEVVVPGQPAIHRVVLMNDGSLLNRYWDENNTPRPEAFKEDVELAHQSKQAPEVLFRNLRAAAESGWDFSSRWFKDAKSFGSIHTTDLIPVDLNCLLCHLEQVLAESYQLAGNAVKSNSYLQRANQRMLAIKKYCWNEEKGFFFDFDYVAQKQKEQFTLAAAFPLFFELASPSQALAVEKIIRADFLKAGGVTTTLEFSGQQWDAPNGWAPLQWMTYKGLTNYGFHQSADQLKSNWVNANTQVYEKSGKMTEKYDVWSEHGEASGGEYPNQDGFGWTNGVYLAMTSPEFS